MHKIHTQLLIVAELVFMLKVNNYMLKVNALFDVQNK